MYKPYVKTNWQDGEEYGASAFNNFENGIKDLEGYAKYREKQARNLAAVIKKIRTGKNFSVCITGDSIMFGFSTLNDKRRVLNTVRGDNMPSDAARLDTTENLTNGLKYLSGADITWGNTTTTMRTEVQPPHTFMDVINYMFGDLAQITYIDKVMTADAYRTNYYRFNASNADLCINNLGTNDALASFLPTDYVGNTDEFVHWVTKFCEREIDNGTAMVLMSPLIATQVVTYDTDGRACLDAYRNILKDIAALYGIPFIDGQDFTTVDGATRIDFCHYTCAGNSMIGKRMAAPLISADMNYPRVIKCEDYLGCSVQKDSIAVRGNAVIDYSDKSPNPRALLDGNDLYGTSANLQNMGMCVMLEYEPSVALHRICDQYARNNCGKTAQEEGYQEAYDTKYAERMTFLTSKHTGEGCVTWAFYTDRDNMVVVPSVWLDPEDANTNEVSMELDFATMIPSTTGSYLNAMSVADLQVELALYDENYEASDEDTKESLITQIKAAAYSTSEDAQQAPENIFNFTGVDTINNELVIPMTTTITGSDVSEAGYYGMNQLATKNKQITITSKGWHTISLKAAQGKAMAFGLTFLPYSDYKRMCN